MVRVLSFIETQLILLKENNSTNQLLNAPVVDIYSFGIYDLLHKKLLIEGSNEIQFIPLKDIIYLKANKNYTEIICENNRKFLSATTLKVQEEKLPQQIFIRANHGYLINLFHLCSIKKHNEFNAIMSNGELIPISSRKKKQVLAKISNSTIVLDKSLIGNYTTVTQ
jgi:DNA-binding LytR/AlgR family response regulator